MDFACFEDSFFESSSSEGEDCGKNGDATTCSHSEKQIYGARICEPQWFVAARQAPLPDVSIEQGSIHDIDFMVLKYKADLFYYQRHYKRASELYEKILLLIPKSNAYVMRETRDALARCYLRLGNGELAKQEAEKLVLPPHERDWSSWKLLGQCLELLQDYEGQVIAFQSSASFQRCHADFWICLSDGFKKLRTASQAQSNSTRLCCRTSANASKEKLAIILARTVQLFRPYFSWRTKTDDDKECVKDLNIEDITVGESEAVDSVRGCGDGDITEANDDDYISASCIQHCVFYRVPLCHTPVSSYYTTLLSGLSHVPRGSSNELSLVPDLNLQLCFSHSPFVMLVRRLLPHDEFIKMMESLHKQSLSDLAHQLLESVFAMAECSCLVWARQLLLYSVRYSHSFPKESLKSELGKVEGQIEACHEGIRAYILQYFSKRSVF